MSSDPDYDDDNELDDDDEVDVLDTTLPQVDGFDIKNWLDLSIGQGEAMLKKIIAQWHGEQDGSVPYGTFQPAKFNGIKKSLALFKLTRERLEGVIGGAPGALPDDADDKFLELVRKTPWHIDGGKK